MPDLRGKPIVGTLSNDGEDDGSDDGTEERMKQKGADDDGDESEQEESDPLPGCFFATGCSLAAAP